MSTTIINNHRMRIIGTPDGCRVCAHNATIDEETFRSWSRTTSDVTVTHSFSSDEGQLRIEAWRAALRTRIMSDADAILAALSETFAGTRVDRTVAFASETGVSIHFDTPALGLPIGMINLTDVASDGTLQVADSTLERKAQLRVSYGYGYLSMNPLLQLYTMALSLQLATKKRDSVSASSFDTAGYDKALQQFDNTLNALSPATALSVTDVVFILESGILIPRNPFDPAWREGALNGAIECGSLSDFSASEHADVAAAVTVITQITSTAAASCNVMLTGMNLTADAAATCYNYLNPSIALGQWSLVTETGVTWNDVSEELSAVLLQSPRALVGLFDDYVSFSVGAGTELQFEAWQGMYEYFLRTLRRFATVGATEHNESVEPGSIYHSVVDVYSATQTSESARLSPGAVELLRYFTWSIEVSQTGAFTESSQRAVNSVLSAPIPTKELAEELGLSWAVEPDGSGISLTASDSAGKVSIRWRGVGSSTPNVAADEVGKLLAAWHFEQELLAVIDTLLATDTRGLVVNETVEGLKLSVRSRAVRTLQTSVPGFASAKEAIISPLYLTTSRASRILREARNG